VAIPFAGARRQFRIAAVLTELVLVGFGSKHWAQHRKTRILGLAVR
jgi:hypothetical protein